MKRAKVGIIGASGYGGGELIRLLKPHPNVELVGFSSRKHQGKPLSESWPQLPYPDLFESQQAVIEKSDILFLAIPNGLAMELAPSLLQAGKRVSDLSADFRLPPEVYQQWYKTPHKSPELYQQAVYGLPEFFRAEIASANLVANPGCYVTASTLALAPLVSLGLVENIIVNAASGVSGAGREAEGTSFAEINENFKAYKVAGSHRHIPEIELNLSRIEAQGRPTETHGKSGEVKITFTPHLAPMSRGILVTAYATPKRVLEGAELLGVYQDFYQNEPFVRVSEALPETKGTTGSNLCWISPKLDARTGQTIVFSAIDNLGKGMASQAVQNLNLMLGLAETTGLCTGGLWP